MKKSICLIMTLLLVTPAAFSRKQNTLSPKERKQGWTLLFDGENGSQWKCTDNKPFDASGWLIEKGELGLRPEKGSNKYSDIITENEYSKFELTAECVLKLRTCNKVL